MRSVEAKLFYGSDAMKISCHKSVAEARRRCRTEYTKDDRVTSWQVVVLEDGKPVVHYTQPPEEKR